MKPIITRKLFNDLKPLILQAKSEVAVSVNSALVKLYWNIGYTIRKEVLKEERADYGKKIIQELSWTHLRQLIYINDDLKREYYVEMCKSESGAVKMNFQYGIEKIN